MNNSNSSANGSCAILGIAQIVVGTILLVASLYGFTVLQSSIVILPALMAVALGGNGVRSLLLNCADVEVSSAV